MRRDMFPYSFFQRQCLDRFPIFELDGAANILVKHIVMNGKANHLSDSLMPRDEIIGVQTISPPLLMSSLIRPVNVRWPSLSSLPWSPVRKNQDKSYICIIHIERELFLLVARIDWCDGASLPRCGQKCNYKFV